ncbi:response regulator transcription factor [Carboxydocella sp. JDF658]|uniref:response regulator transcription factor n=1 Tax=Carboxydocella sp. JDF658 TaxID=1926600 RepID=UPI0009AE460A|nr:response regulator transcription factor [Carboxydocella sp. JDF658]GAW32776.1 DNA-binding response regulator [Carboxydocella sp. JDF658]
MAEKKILVVDDEMRMRKLVGDFLKKEGYAVREAADGRQALEIFQREHPDLVILDVMMPEYDGWAVCREIRKTSRVPIIMLTARGEEEDELFGFDLGADEYIAKPFSLKILAARIQALLRRLENRQVAIRNYDGLEIDEPGRNVYVNGERIELTPKEFDLLLYLADNAGRALNRDQILNAVWNYDYFGDTRTVDTHIKRLRLKLGEKSELIQTVRGVGYRFEVKK